MSWRGILAYAAGLLIGGAVLLVGGSGIGAPRDSDLAYVWAGPRTILDGGDPYDTDSWRASVQRLGTPPHVSPPVYAYPPAVVILLLPLALVPIEPLGIIWTFGSLAAAIVVLGVLLQRHLATVPAAHGFAGFALLAAQPSAQTLFNIQWSFWLVAAFGGALLLLARGRGLAAGVLAAGLLVKPQLFLVAVPAVVLQALSLRRPAFLAGILGSAVLALGLSVVAGPSAWGAWLAAAGEVSERARIANTATAVHDLIGPAARPVAWIALVAATVAALLRFGAGSLAWLGTALALSLSLAPYARSYDQPLLVVAIVLVAGDLALRGHRRGALLLAAIGSVGYVAVGWLLRVVAAEAIGSESPLGLVPAAIALLCLVFAWRRTAIR